MTTSKLYLPPHPTGSTLHSSYHHKSGKLLIVGDVHGCFDELSELVRQEDIVKGRDMVIVAGDLVCKGPNSKEVIEFMMENNFMSILGNHELYTLRCAYLSGRFGSSNLGDDEPLVMWNPEAVEKVDLGSREYALSYFARMNGFELASRNRVKTHDHYNYAASLSDAQLEWLARLPLSIDLREGGFPFVIVHAGIAPNISLNQQHPYHLVMMRNLVKEDKESNFNINPSTGLKNGTAWSMHLSENEKGEPSIENPTFVFGHDATRGFQRPNAFRLGLDTGCCNGNYLTGLLLPERKIVSVKAKKVYQEPNGEIKNVLRDPPTGKLLSEIPFEYPSFPENKK